MELRDCNYLIGENWKQLEKLEKLSIYSCRNLKNYPFVDNIFENLEELKLEKNYSIKHLKNWNPLIKLNKLILVDQKLSEKWW